MKLEDKHGIFFYLCLFIFTFPIPLSHAEIHDTEHFRIIYAGEQNALYARLTGAYLEEAYALFKDTFEFKKVGVTNILLGKKGVWEVELLRLLPPFFKSPGGEISHWPLLEERGASHGRLQYGLTALRYQELHQTCFHEYFHAVTNRYLPFAALDFLMKVPANGEVWCIEGSLLLTFIRVISP